MKIIEKMIVKRIINNNIVLRENFKGHEVIAIGSGLGFKKEKNDQV
jgi:beta-glucoside operon transcriptional antiterminator